jgi:gliding motility-associated-like protein
VRSNPCPILLNPCAILNENHSVYLKSFPKYLNIMKKIYCILFFIFPFFAFAQTTAPDIEWQRCYGTEGIDGVSIFSTDGRPFEVGNLEGNIVVLDDGSTVFATNINPYSTGGQLISSGDVTVPPNPSYTMTWLVKVSPQGSIIWQKLFTGVIVQYITKTADGGFMMSANKIVSNYSAGDDIVLKVSATGQEQWRKVIHIGDPNDTWLFAIKSIQQTNDGGYICIGMESFQSLGILAIAMTCTPISTYTDSNVIITKISATGVTEWQQCMALGIERVEYAIAGQQTADGGYIITGAAQRTDPNGYYTGNRVILVVKLSSTGSIEWNKKIGDGHFLTLGCSIFQTADGGYIVGGSTEENTGVFAGLNPYGWPFPGGSAYSKFAPCFLKLNSTGDILWTKVIGGEISERCLWAEPTRDGGFVTVSTLWKQFGAPNYPRMTWVTKHDANGNMQWDKYIGGYIPHHVTTQSPGSSGEGYRFNGGQCIRETPDGGYMVYGYAFRDGQDICGNFGWTYPGTPPRVDPTQDIWLCKLKTLPAPPEITGNLALVCTSTTTLTAEQPLPQPTPPATYLWSNNATTQTISNVGAGTYTVTITYENRCTKSTSVTVQANSINIPASGIAYTPATCAATNGAATISASGGLAPYIYTCASGSISANTVSGLSFGTYTVSITDANGCTGSTAITIPQAASTLAATATTTPTGCAAATGTATITIQNGVAPYSYTINGGASNTAVTNTFNLPSSGGAGFGVGTYAVSFTDANGCTASTTFIITQAANNLIAIAAATQIPCAGGTGSISVSVTNGIAPFTYTVNGGASNTAVTNTFNLLSSGGAGGGFGVGSYLIVITDATGCTVSTTATINAAPTALTANITTQNATCGLSNGSLSANISGGIAPYIVTWTGNGLNGSTTTATNTVLLPSSGGAGGGFSVGAYVVTITDINACTFIAPSANIVGNPPITATITTTPTKCYGEASGSIAISNIQNAVLPVLYSIDNQLLSATNPIANIKGGTHTIKIEDATGCKLETTTIVAEGPRFTIAVGRDTLLTIGDSLYIEGNITSGFPVSPTQYVWTCSPEVRLKLKGISGAIAHVEPYSGGLGEASCVLVATDARGCTATDALTIRLKDASSIFIPNAFTPNGDGYNEEFVIFGGALVERVELLRIFDRWGELVHQKTDFAPNTPAWDGLFNSVGAVPRGVGAVPRACPTSVYVYYTQIRMRNGELRTLSGDVTLLR